MGNCVVVEDVLALEPAGETFMGAVRWSAPQLLQGGPKTEATDVFAFAMTVLEVRWLSLGLVSISDKRSESSAHLPVSQLMTDLPPYAPELHSDVLVNKAIQSGQRPARPTKKVASRGLDDKLWSLLGQMWAQESRRRPTAMEVREEMRVVRRVFDRAQSVSKQADANMSAFVACLLLILCD